MIENNYEKNNYSVLVPFTDINFHFILESNDKLYKFDVKKNINVANEIIVSEKDKFDKIYNGIDNRDITIIDNIFNDIDDIDDIDLKNSELSKSINKSINKIKKIDKIEKEFNNAKREIIKKYQHKLPKNITTKKKFIDVKKTLLEYINILDTDNLNISKETYVIIKNY